MADIAIGIDDYEDSAPGNDKEKGAVGSPKVEEEANGVVASPQGPPETGASSSGQRHKGSVSTQCIQLSKQKPDERVKVQLNEAGHALGDYEWSFSACLSIAVQRNMLLYYTDFENVPFALKTSIISYMKNFFDWGDNPKLEEGILHRVARIHRKIEMMGMKHYDRFKMAFESLANPPPNLNMNKLKEANKFRENDAFKESDEFKGHLEKNKGNRNKASVPTRTLEMTSLDSLKQKHMQKFINDQPLSDQGSLDPGDLSEEAFHHIFPPSSQHSERVLSDGVVSTKSSVYGQGSGPSKQEFDQLQKSVEEMHRKLDRSHEIENQLSQVLQQTTQQNAQLMQMIDMQSGSTSNSTPTIPCHDHNEIKNKIVKFIDWLHKYTSCSSEPLEKLGQKESDAIKSWMPWILTYLFFLCAILAGMTTWKVNIGSIHGMLDQNKTITPPSNFHLFFAIFVPVSILALVSLLPVVAMLVRPDSITTFKIIRIIGVLILLVAVLVLFMLPVILARTSV